MVAERCVGLFSRLIRIKTNHSSLEVFQYLWSLMNSDVVITEADWHCILAFHEPPVWQWFYEITGAELFATYRAELLSCNSVAEVDRRNTRAIKIEAFLKSH